MASTITFNGATFSIPSEGDSNWGTNVSNYLIAIASGALQKTGGTFTLSAEVDFGATYGLKSSYFKSKATNPSSAGILRLGNTESVGWRNAANNADLLLTVTALNELQFNGTKVTLAGAIVNADIAALAAISLSKLAAVTASKVLVSDASGFISASTVSTTTLGFLDATSSIQTQLDGKQASGSYALTTGNLSQFAATTSAQLAGVISDETGSGSLVFATSPSLTTPSLGVATATSINSTTIPTSKTLVVTTDKLSVLAATTSAELAGVISDETGSGSLVFATSPSFTTPSLGVATATSVNGTNIPTSKTLVVTTDKLSVLAATTSAELAGVISDETGSGSLVFANTPTLVTPVLGAATGTSIALGGTLNASAILQADSTTKGFLLPRMTQTQRDAIATPATGLEIYNTDTAKLNFYNGTAWVEIGTTTSVVLVVGRVQAAVTANTTIASWSAPIKDTNSAFNATSGVYTCPGAGDYQVSVSGSLPVTGSCAIKIVSGSTTIIGTVSTAGATRGFVLGIIPNAIVGTTITIQADSSVTLNGELRLEIHKI